MILFAKHVRSILVVMILMSSILPLTACAPSASVHRFDLSPESLDRFVKERLEPTAANVGAAFADGAHKKAAVLPCLGQTRIFDQNASDSKEVARARAEAGRHRIEWHTRVVGHIKGVELKTPTIAEIAALVSDVDVAKLDQFDDPTALRIAKLLEVDAIVLPRVDYQLRFQRTDDQTREIIEMIYGHAILDVATGNLIHAGAAEDRTYRELRPASDSSGSVNSQVVGGQ